jgi:hypothetical protein
LVAQPTCVIIDLDRTGLPSVSTQRMPLPGPTGICKIV